MLRLIGLLNFTMTLSAIGALLVLTGGVPATTWPKFATGTDISANINDGAPITGGAPGNIWSGLVEFFSQTQAMVVKSTQNFSTNWDIALSNKLVSMREALYAGDFVAAGLPILIVLFGYLSLRFLARALWGSQRRTRRARVVHFV